MSDTAPAAPAPGEPTARDRLGGVLYSACFAAAVALCVGLWLRLPGIYFRDSHGEHPQPWLLVVVPVLLLLLSFFHVSRKKLASRFRLSVSGLRISVSVLTALAFCVAFGYLLADPLRADPADAADTLVFILGFAALIIGGQHLVEFHEAQGMLERVNRQLDESTSKLSKATLDIEGRVASLTQTLGYAEYRRMVNVAYGKAETRVRACTNHWPVDPTFWSEALSTESDLGDPAFWEGQEVYDNLRQAVASTRGRPGSLQMVFVGRFSLSLARAPALSVPEFTLFVGILWRLAVAHRLRAEMRRSGATETYRRESSVRVMVADVPINCHVIDEEAFLLLHLPIDGRAQSYGLRLTMPEGSAPGQPGLSRPSVADTYAEIIERYTRTHVHSAREYVASLLVMAATAIADDHFGKVVLMRGTTPDRGKVTVLLETLGMEDWLDWQSGPQRDIPTKDVKLDRKHWEGGATLLLGDFLSHYYAPNRVEPRAGGRDGDEGELTVEDLVGDLL